MKEVRVRFAPSPTGALHIGGVRTALYNYLFAKKYSGKFILRIEDTDRKRYVQNAEDYILNSLNWLGIRADESPELGGESIFYRQSERIDIYNKYIKLLLDAGHAYYAFDTPEELEKMRMNLFATKISSPKYNVNTRLYMRNSLVLPYDEIQQLLHLKIPYVIRMKIPTNRVVRFHDKVHGWIKVDARELEDKILMKSDLFPTYHFANVVDDHLMRISHVIRGEEWLPSTPIHVLLYEFFDWTDTIPEFVHLPLILNSSGKGKLSKRDGINMDFPVFPLSWNIEGSEIRGFKERGFLPSAVLNFLALMGWNSGIKKEVFSLSELIAAFSLERIGKSGTKFDIDKAKWLNQQHLRLLDKNYVCQYIKDSLKRDGIEVDEKKVQELYVLLLERAIFLEDIILEAKSILLSPIYNKSYYGDIINDDNKNILIYLINALDSLDFYTKENLKNVLEGVAINFDFSKGKIMSNIRNFVTGNKTGPDLLKTLLILGKEEVMIRLKNLFSLFF